MLKFKELSKSSFFLAAVLYLLVAAFWLSRGDIWTTADYQILDLFQKQAIKNGLISFVSPKIAAIVETDETKKYFKQSVLDRKIYATVNNFLINLKPKAVIYDFIFQFEENTESNFEFKKGPIFSNVVLIDEINRAPAKTQAALFEVMEEKQKILNM